MGLRATATIACLFPSATILPHTLQVLLLLSRPFREKTYLYLLPLLHLYDKVS
jgi:hypothetical protein